MGFPLRREGVMGRPMRGGLNVHLPSTFCATMKKFCSCTPISAVSAAGMLNKLIIDQGELVLCFKRFGCTTDWKPERKEEALPYIRLQLKAQLNLYGLSRAPFADDGIQVEVYWQATLRVVPELAEVALFFLSAPVSEAAVERTFSCQSFWTPLFETGCTKALFKLRCLSGSTF